MWREASSNFENSVKDRVFSLFKHLEELKQQETNANTTKSTTNWLSVWKNWAGLQGHNVKLKAYSACELDKILQQFYAMIMALSL